MTGSRVPPRRARLLARYLSPNRDPRTLRGRLLPPSVRRALVRSTAAAFYRGDTVSCPICGRSYRAFLPDWTRLNAVCPGCESEERHRLLWHFLTTVGVQVLDGADAVLHVAPEDTFQPLLTARGFRYVTTDLYADGVDVRADLTRLPFPDSRFALVVCGHVLEHVDDDRAALREVCRVLRPGGLALLLVPIDPGLDRTVDVPAGADPRDYGIEQIDHRRQYGRDAVDRIRAADLAVAGNYAGQLDPALVHRHAMSSAGMYVAVKER